MTTDAIHRLGPFTVHWNDPGLGTTGVRLVTLPEGTCFISCWWQVVTVFNGDFYEIALYVDDALGGVGESWNNYSGLNVGDPDDGVLVDFRRATGNIDALYAVGCAKGGPRSIQAFLDPTNATEGEVKIWVEVAPA